MHAFDADKLRGGEIIVRLAREGEQLNALNGERYNLDPSNLMIADPVGAVALAGVIGGAVSATADTSTGIVLESAIFDAARITRAFARVTPRTQAPMAFEVA